MSLLCVYYVCYNVCVLRVFCAKCVCVFVCVCVVCWGGAGNARAARPPAPAKPPPNINIPTTNITIAHNAPQVVRVLWGRIEEQTAQVMAADPSLRADKARAGGGGGLSAARRPRAGRPRARGPPLWRALSPRPPHAHSLKHTGGGARQGALPGAGRHGSPPPHTPHTQNA